MSRSTNALRPATLPLSPIGHPSLVSLTLMIPPTRCKQRPKRLTMIRGTQTTSLCWGRPLFRKFENFGLQKLHQAVFKSLARWRAGNEFPLHFALARVPRHGKLV
jgi:hypothetical protein